MSLINKLTRSLDPLQGVPDSIRQEFVLWYRQAKAPQIRYVAFLTLSLYFVYIFMEYNIATTHRELRLLAHGVLVPAALLAVGLMSNEPRYYRPMLALLMSAPIGAVAANLYLNHDQPDFAAYAPEMYLNLMWTFSVSGLTLRQATFTASTSAALMLIVTLESSLQPGVQCLNLLWILASYSFGMLSAFLLERAHKTMFLHQNRLALSASVDGLTGIWNRARIDQFFADEVARAQRYGTPFSVILMDIDHFKSVNDTHGHTVGDSVLCQFARLLRENVRSTDRVGRLGGEEFLVVLPGTDHRHAQAAARALRQRINGFDFHTVRRKTASFGVTQYCGDDSASAMLERVDRALYRAKQNGRDRIEVL
ncbi:GGDEF domain-containing protein [Pseudomonas knackmussii]|uniref:GGDEF domain-containing protein n=1 Tax=Pseudomonas knackmussii TaxID=65741 RepID=UPI003F4A0B22